MEKMVITQPHLRSPSHKRWVAVYTALEAIYPANSTTSWIAWETFKQMEESHYGITDLKEAFRVEVPSR